MAPEETHVEHFRREGELWVLAETRDPKDRLVLGSIGIELPLADIYDRVEEARAQAQPKNR